MKKVKKTAAFILAVSMMLPLILLTGCGDGEYDITLEMDKTDIVANGSDKAVLTAVVKDKNGKVIETDEVEFYEDRSRTAGENQSKLPALIVYPEYRTKESGRHIIYAKYKDSVSKTITISASAVKAGKINVAADKYNIKNDGKDTATLTGNVLSPEGEKLGYETEIFANGIKINSNKFNSSVPGIYYITAKYDNTYESNIIAVNVSDNAENTNKLTLSAGNTFILGVTESIELRATLTDKNGKKISGANIEYYERDNKLNSNKFKPDKAGVYTIYAKCDGIISNTVNITAKEPEFIDAESTKLPVIVINTDGQTINNSNKVDATMMVYDSKESLNKATDTPSLITNIRIKTRGQSSQTFPKKQYGIELKDNNWEDVSYPLIGMGKEEDWVLNGSYADKSLMRNHIAYALAAQCSEYAPATKFCEVYINDSNDTENPYNYMGIYLLIEKIKIDENRVDINKLDETITDGDKLTGGYIVAKDKVKTGEAKIVTNKGDFTFVSPNEEKINQTQTDYITNYLNDFVNALFGGDYKDPYKGYANYLDLESYATILVLNEFTKCIDGMNISLYYYKPRNEKLHAGPAWDFDLSMGNVDYRTGTDPAGWYCVSLDEFPRRMMSDNAFRIMFERKWNELRGTVFSDENIDKIIDNAMDTISGEPLERSLARWPGQWNGMFVWPNPSSEERYTSNYQDEVDYLRYFLKTRAGWIDENITGYISLEPVFYDWINEYTGERMPREAFDADGNRIENNGNNNRGRRN